MNMFFDSLRFCDLAFYRSNFTSPLLSRRHRGSPSRE